MNAIIAIEEPTAFDEHVQRRIGKYVYRLIDPRDGQTFYVGKGTGNRVFEHARGEITQEADELLPPKLETIRAIKAAGKTVQHLIHRHGLNDEQAFLVEAALIDAYPNLTNAVNGHGPGDSGLMTARGIVIKFGFPALSIDPPHRLFLINIRKLENRYDRYEIYNLARYCWRINKARAEKADFILAVLRGVVLGAYVAEEWLQATRENFPEIEYADGSEAHRWGFKGYEAPQDICEWYVGVYGKRIVQPELRHDQYPIRYWQC